MNLLVADTSALISLVSLDDANHAKAVRWSEQIFGDQTSIVIPGEVFTEFMNVFGKRAGHDEAMAKGRLLLVSPEYQIVETTSGVRERALLLFNRQKQSVSFTDCIVMAFADEYQTNGIFGFDHVFVDNGYNAPSMASAA